MMRKKTYGITMQAYLCLLNISVHKFAASFVVKTFAPKQAFAYVIKQRLQ